MCTKLHQSALSCCCDTYYWVLVVRSYISSSLQSATAYFSTKCDKCYNRVRQRNVLLARPYVSIFQPLTYVIHTLNTAMFSERWHFIRLLKVSTLNTAMFYVRWYFIWS